MPSQTCQASLVGGFPERMGGRGGDREIHEAALLESPLIQNRDREHKRDDGGNGGGGKKSSLGSA